MIENDQIVKNGADLTRNEYDMILREIWKNHRFAKGGRSIKYVDPHWDMRDGMCFAIKFRGLFGHGNIMFDGRQSDKSMYDRIRAWLNGEDDTEAEVDERK